MSTKLSVLVTALIVACFLGSWVGHAQSGAEVEADCTVQTLLEDGVPLSDATLVADYNQKCLLKKMADINEKLNALERRFEAGEERIGGRKRGNQPIEIRFERQFPKPPVVLATVRSSPNGDDIFWISVTEVNQDGFRALVCRDPGCRSWGADYTALYWLAILQ